MTESLLSRIIQYLEANPDKTAKEIGAALGEDKKAVNALLYGALKGQAVQDSKYRWRLAASGASSQVVPAATFADTDLARLSRYYLACLGQDGLGVSVFAESKFLPNYMELPGFPGGGPDFWETEAARTMLGQVRRDRSRLVLYLGYPTTLHLRRSKKSSWQGYMVEPIFLFPVQLDDQMRPTLDIGFPSINQNVVARFTNASPQDVMNELVRLEEELGLADANFAPELDELISRLHAIRPEWPWLETPDTEQFSAEPPLPQLQQEGIVNRAVLLVTERSPFTQGLESELTQLARLKPGATDGTALGDWLAAAEPRKVAEVPPPLEVLPMNLEQREAVATALGSSLTIITGPPGTGKSQVVTNLLLNAVWNGKRVLFASKNNKAVDVVEQRVNNLGPRPVLLRLGSNQYQSALAEYLMTLLASATSAADHEEYQDAVARHEQLQKRLASINQKVERLIDLRNQTDRLDQEVEDFRGELGDQSFAGLRSLDTETVEQAVQYVSAAVAAADVNCQSGFSRLVLPLLRNGRMEAISAAVAECKDVLAQLSLSAPTVAPS
ncbi:MAG: AAA family ATPase, partial [Marinobacter sp.]|nr:AAA family ATPase [Marinobacter sp.]